MKFAIGIGGSGARCLEALVYLCAAGLGPAEKIGLVIVDADKSNGNVKRTKLIVEAYRNLYAATVNGIRKVDPDCPILQTELELMEPAPWNPLSVREGNREIECKKLKEFLLLATEENATPAEKLLRILYTPSQLDANLEEGFLGRPSIGAAVFALTLERNGLGPWQDVLRKAADQADDRFFLFGSVFGGTGAAGMPTLPKLLRDYLNQQDNRGSQKSYFGGALLLPYFEFEDHNSKIRDLYAHPGEFLANTRAALIHYAENFGEYYNRLYILGEKPGRTLHKYNAGGSAQENPAHYVEMLAASAALQFLTASDSSPSPQAPQLVIGAREIPDDNRSVSEMDIAPMDGKEPFNWEDVPWPIIKDGQTANDTARLKEKLGIFTRMCFSYTDLHQQRFQKFFEGKASSSVPWMVDLEITSNERTVFDHWYTICTGYRAWIMALHDANHGVVLSLLDRKAIDEHVIGKFVVGNQPEQAKKLPDVWRLMCADRGHVVPGQPFPGFVLTLYHACR